MAANSVATTIQPSAGDGSGSRLPADVNCKHFICSCFFMPCRHRLPARSGANPAGLSR
ncbi:hypothetical protein DAI22_09g057600 [Oryza sativa Japonica Group]|nr:hypothetical protein DAI22_09g057600 [Oryza sativa Japonica Group]